MYLNTAHLAAVLIGLLRRGIPFQSNRIPRLNLGRCPGWEFDNGISPGAGESRPWMQLLDSTNGFIHAPNDVNREWNEDHVNRPCGGPSKRENQREVSGD